MLKICKIINTLSDYLDVFFLKATDSFDEMLGFCVSDHIEKNGVEFWQELAIVESVVLGLKLDKTFDWGKCLNLYHLNIFSNEFREPQFLFFLLFILQLLSQNQLQCMNLIQRFLLPQNVTNPKFVYLNDFCQLSSNIVQIFRVFFELFN